MSKAEILAELPNLSSEELAEVRACLDALAGDGWIDNGELSEEDKAALDLALEDYRNDPEAGEDWEVVRARIEAKLRP